MVANDFQLEAEPQRPEIMFVVWIIGSPFGGSLVDLMLLVPVNIDFLKNRCCF